MSFLYPLGLLGLIGVPILIIIYIIKNKHTEQVISSTYLWNLSEKFLKRKRPISIISGLISLFLQIIAVVSISLALAHPVFTIADSAKEYCFILDASGSMNMINNNISRIDLGKDKIKEIIEDSTDGSKYTLIYAGSTVRVVYEKLGDKGKACELLEKLEPSGVTITYNNTLKYVQEYFNQNSSLITYLITDKEYNSSNIEIINVSNNENNYAIVDTNYVINGSVLKIDGKVISYESDATLTLAIYIDDILVEEQDVLVSKLVEEEFFYESDIIDFTSIKVEIKNIDGLTLDNTNIIYNVEKAHENSTLIISDAAFFLYSAIDTIGNTSIDVIKPEEYDSNVSGYDLYIFDSYAPSALPSDGTIWMFGITTSVNGAGFSVQDIVENEEGMLLTYPKNSSSAFKTLTNGLVKEDIYVSKYVKYGLYRNFTTLLTHEGNPVIFTGTTDSGCREVVFAFDLHNSNLPLLMDYLLFVNNFLNYSFPIFIENSSYVCGDNVQVNVLSNCDSIRVDSPNGNTTYLDVSSEFAEFTTNEVGTYTLTVMIGNDSKVFTIFVSLPEEESTSIHEITELSLQGNLENNYTDGIYDKLIIIFIIIAVIYMADWMVYCYEQHQLR